MAEDLAREVTKIGATLDDVCRRVTKIETDNSRLAEKLTSLTTSNAVILQGQQQMQATLGELTKKYSDVSDRQRKQEQKPAEHWTKLMWVIGTAIVTAIMTLVIAKIGLS